MRIEDVNIGTAALAGDNLGGHNEFLSAMIGVVMLLREVRLGGGELLTVVRCEVASDGSFCRVYVSSLEGIDKAKQAVKGFESASGEQSVVLARALIEDMCCVVENVTEHTVVNHIVLIVIWF